MIENYDKKQIYMYYIIFSIVVKFKWMDKQSDICPVYFQREKVTNNIKIQVYVCNVQKIKYEYSLFNIKNV